MGQGLLERLRNALHKRLLIKSTKRYLAGVSSSYELKLQKRLIYDFFSREGLRVLLVLDACRLDYFMRHANLFEGIGHHALFPALSCGSCTKEWFIRTFTDPLRDVIYISATPCAFRVQDKFARVVRLWEHGWDKELETVRVGRVSEAVRIAIKRGARKLIAHYMQPHAPFVRGSWLNKLRRGGKAPYFLAYVAARRSPMARREFVRAYDENVSYVMSEVARLVRWLINRARAAEVAITSDHGECLGRWAPLLFFRKRIWMWTPWLLGIYRLVGHPCHTRYPELVVVPWMTISTRSF